MVVLHKASWCHASSSLLLPIGLKMEEQESAFVSWGQLNMFSETFIKKVCSDASHAFLAVMHNGVTWSSANINGNVEAGLLSSKTVCLVETFLGYRFLIYTMISAYFLETVCLCFQFCFSEFSLIQLLGEDTLHRFCGKSDNNNCWLRFFQTTIIGKPSTLLEITLVCKVKLGRSKTRKRQSHFDSQLDMVTRMLKLLNLKSF